MSLAQWDGMPADSGLERAAAILGAFDPAHRELLLAVDTDTWREEADLTGEYFTTFGAHLPEQLWQEHEALRQRLKSAS